MSIDARRLQRSHDFYPPAAELAAVPALYGTEDIPVEDKVVHLHYFTGSSDWWITELDPESGLAFGYVRLNGDDINAEWGYIDLTELEAVYRPAVVANTGGQIRVSVPVIVERDLQWTPRPMSEVLTHS